MSIFDFFSKNDNNKDLQSKVLSVKKVRCPQNHPCPSVRICPVGALTQYKFEAPKVDLNKCVKCGKCVKLCPTRALVLE